MTRRRVRQLTSALAGIVQLLCAARAVPVLLDPVRLLDDAASRCDGPYPWPDAVGFALLVGIAVLLAAGGVALLRRVRRGGGPSWLVVTGLLIGVLAVVSVATAPPPQYEGSSTPLRGGCDPGEPSLARPLGLASGLLLLAGAGLLTRRSRP